MKEVFGIDRAVVEYAVRGHGEEIYRSSNDISHRRPLFHRDMNLFRGSSC